MKKEEAGSMHSTAWKKTHKPTWWPPATTAHPHCVLWLVPALRAQWWWWWAAHSWPGSLWDRAVECTVFPITSQLKSYAVGCEKHWASLAVGPSCLGGTEVLPSCILTYSLQEMESTKGWASWSTRYVTGKKKKEKKIGCQQLLQP